MIVLDTHVWVWWMSNPDRLSRRARDVAEEAAKDQAVFVSSISAWEVALLVAKNRLQLAMDVTDWMVKAESVPFVHFVPVDNTIAVKSVTLPGPLHDDPADRIIIATALSKGSAILTKDKRILQYPHVKTIW